MVPPWCQVILGTNIAESSVTIGDVEVVIDSGLSRGRQWVFHEPTQ
jgi:HrpA-like RNA helicase